MNGKKVNGHLLKYELLNAYGNLFTVFFGIAFPIIMSLLIANLFLGEIPHDAIPAANTGVFITMSLIVPMSTLFIGYAANYSQELDKGVPLRFKLFGYNESSILISKMIANLVFMTVALMIYTVFDIVFLKIQMPSVKGVVSLILSLYLLSALMFMFAHGVALFFGKFGPTYGITMTLYFCFMILSGMMGITVDKLPMWLQSVAKLLPMTYISRDFIGFWRGGSYDFGPIVLSFVFFGAISCVVLFLGVWKNRRKGYKLA